VTDGSSREIRPEEQEGKPAEVGPPRGQRKGGRSPPGLRASSGGASIFYYCPADAHTSRSLSLSLSLKESYRNELRLAIHFARFWPKYFSLRLLSL